MSATLSSNNESESRWYWIVGGISVAVSAVVVFLMMKAGSNEAASADIYILPKINAILNSVTAALLVVGYLLIRRKKVAQHKAVMLTAFGCASAFLILYVIFHYLAPQTKYPADAGPIKYVYYVILLTHIVLAALVLPAILLTLSRAFTERYDKHRKLARITLPVWFYVSVTGVVVYLMISPYYGQQNETENEKSTIENSRTRGVPAE